MDLFRPRSHLVHRLRPEVKNICFCCFIFILIACFTLYLVLALAGVSGAGAGAVTGIGADQQVGFTGTGNYFIRPALIDCCKPVDKSNEKPQSVHRRR